MARENQKAVFVAGIKSMQPTKYLISARVRLEGAYRLDDICSGKVYLSAFDSSLKAFCFSDKWEHNLKGAGGFIVRHPVKREIEGRAEIVDGVAEDERPFVGDGFLSFTGDDVLAGLWLVLDDQSEWSFLHERANFGIKVVDVMFGPASSPRGRSRCNTVRA